MIRTGALAVVTLALGGCSMQIDAPVAKEPRTADGDVGGQSSAIVDGIAGGDPAVVFLYNLAGAACTGTVIAPRVVLTAKHCIQASGAFAAPASQFRVYIGDSIRSLTAEYRVQEIRPAPGCWDLCGDASDVAVMILATATDVEPIPISYDSPASLIGQRITAIGYGQTPSGRSGIKYHTEKYVQMEGGGLLFVEPTVCSGDSGGPLIAPDGAIYGVASFIYSPDGSTAPQCGTAPGAYNAIQRWGALIDQAIEDSGSCAGRAVEECNGIDDNCDQVVDEGCTPLGEPCTSSDECVGGLCDDTPAGRVCTQACDPLRPGLGCSNGLYCARAGGCDGLCAPLRPVAEPAPFGSRCEFDGDCRSMFCADPGDGLRRCMRPCRGGEATCLSDEVCVAGPGACGGCLDAKLVSPPRNFGEPCNGDDECRSSVCLADGGLRYCSLACASNDDCGVNSHCRDGSCVRGPMAGFGSRCMTSADCEEGSLCAVRGDDVRWCTTLCTDSCPTGFACTDVSGGRVCTPELRLLGEVCTNNVDCISGLCAGVGDRSLCTQFCGPEAFCGQGFECTDTGDGINAVCLPPSTPVEPSGCSASDGKARAAPGSLLGLALVAGVLWRRRRR